MNARERNLALVTGAVVALGLGISLIEPAFKHWDELGDERAELVDSLQRNRELAEALPELRLERAALDARLRTTDGEAVVPGIVALVRDLSRQAGFEPTSLRFLRSSPLDPSHPEGPFAELRFDLRARADLAKLTRFCVLLAASERAIRVNSWSLAPRSEDSDLEASLSLVALAPADQVQEGAR